MTIQKKNNVILATAFASAGEVSRSAFTTRELSALRMLPRSKHEAHLAGVLALRRVLADLYPDTSLIEVLRRDGAPPSVFLDGTHADSVAISVSHSGSVGFAAAAPGGAMLGADIELNTGFPLLPKQFFSPEELRRKSHRDPVLVWAYKEALLKALGRGLRIHPRRVTLSFDNKDAMLGAAVDRIPISLSGVRVEGVSGLTSVVIVLNGSRRKARFSRDE